MEAAAVVRGERGGRVLEIYLEYEPKQSEGALYPRSFSNEHNRNLTFRALVSCQEVRGRNTDVDSERDQCISVGSSRRSEEESVIVRVNTPNSTLIRHSKMSTKTTNSYSMISNTLLSSSVSIFFSPSASCYLALFSLPFRHTRITKNMSLLWIETSLLVLPRTSPDSLSIPATLYNTQAVLKGERTRGK